MARLLLPPLTLHLFLYIPRSAAGRWTRVAPFLYLPAASLLLIQADLAFTGGALVTGRPTVARLMLLDRIELAHLLLFAGLALAVLVRRLRSMTDWEQHRQLLWLTVGMTAGYLPFFLFQGLPALVGWRLPESISTLTVLPLVCVPFAFAWAVLRYRLWDLGVMVRDGMSYGLTAILGVTTFSLIDLALRRSLPEGLHFARDLATFFGGILVLGLIVPAHRGIHGALERLQYGHAFGRRRGLARVGQELLKERDLDRLCAALLGELVQGLDLERANLLLPQGPSLVPVRPEPGLPPSIALASLRDELWDGDFETLSPVGMAGEPASSEQQLYGAGYHYVFPLEVRGSRVGMAVTTLRRDHLPMSSEDIEIARGLLDQAALAIENAQLLDQVHRQLERVTTLQRQNQDILESSPAGIVVLDESDRIVSANLAFAALAGRQRSELTARPFAEVLPDLLLPAPGTGMHQVATHDEAGADRHLQITAAPLGEGVGARRVVVLQDVTERVLLEQALKEQDRLASLGVLAAGVAHEVNTPLTGISSYAQMLLSETAGDDPRRELLEKVERQTFRASRIVNNLLDFARKREHEIADVDLVHLVSETVDLVEDRFAKRGVKVIWQVPLVPVTVRGAEGELQQVIANLLLNALDATAEQGSGEVEVQLADDGETVRIVVEDDGPGILPENLARIFEPFFTTKSGKGGTGLGLAISREIVEKCGGSISAENLCEGGCRFVVELPAAGSGGGAS
ncbi:MAG: ATP-binding protein [Thermoanaerobaculia bacterium]